MNKKSKKYDSNSNSDNDNDSNSSTNSATKLVKSKYRQTNAKNPKDIYKDAIEWMAEFKESKYVESDDEAESKGPLPWVERFRPKTMDDIISQTQTINTLKECINKRQMPHLLLYGPPGTGKTSTILACAKELYKNNYSLMVLEINASEERGIEVIRNKVKNFIMTKGVFLTNDMSLFKLVILDEADALTTDAQAMLRSVIEKHTENVRFCLICNSIKKINLAVQSRCTTFKFAPLPINLATKKLITICKESNIAITNDGAETILRIAKGDMRKAINILQSTSMIFDKITSDNVTTCAGYPSKTHIKSIINIVMNDTIKESYGKIKTIINTNGYALSDVITEISDTLISNFVDGDKAIKQDDFCSIMCKLKDIELNLIVCPNENIQLAGIISSFV